MDKINFELFDEQVDRFLNNQMNETEETDFKALLAGNDELRQRAHSIAFTIKEMKAIQAKRDADCVKTIQGMSEKEFRELAGIKAKKTHLVSLFTKIAVAACLAGFAFFGVARYQVYQDTIELGNASYLAYVADLSEYGGSRGIEADGVVKQLEDLFLQVKEGDDLKTAITSLENIYNKAQNEDSEYSEFIDDIAWNLSIAYLKTGERDKPLPMLEEMLIRNEDYPDITEPVQKLITDIKNL